MEVVLVVNILLFIFLSCLFWINKDQQEEIRSLDKENKKLEDERNTFINLNYNHFKREIELNKIINDYVAALNKLSEEKGLTQEQQGYLFAYKRVIELLQNKKS